MVENKILIMLEVIQKNRVVLGGIGWSPNTTQFKLEAFWDIGGSVDPPNTQYPSAKMNTKN